MTIVNRLPAITRKQAIIGAFALSAGGLLVTLPIDNSIEIIGNASFANLHVLRTIGHHSVALAACSSDADVASRNLSQAADNCQISRRVVFYNPAGANHYAVNFKPSAIFPDANIR